MPKSMFALSTVVLLAAGNAALAAMDLGSLPTLRSGLWLTTVSNEGMKPTTVSMCIDEATQQRLLMMGQGAMAGLCAKSDLRRDGDAFVFDSDCTMGPMRVRSSGRTTFTGTIAYNTESLTRFDPPLMGRDTMRSMATGRHGGACPADMKPGDVKLPDGRVLNVGNLPGLMALPR